MRNELYFCTELTESEHDIVYNMLTEKCINNDIKLHYYRKLKDGHVPLFRECKISGKPIGQLQKFIEDLNLEMSKNPHKN